MEEEEFKVPLILQFDSEVKDGKYYRIGKDQQISDALYRVATDWELNQLTVEEKLLLVQAYDREYKTNNIRKT